MNNLKVRKIWIPWINGNPGKRPSLDGKTYAKWSDRSILMTYEEADALYQSKKGLAGVGFVIPKGIAVIDLDRCIIGNDGELNEPTLNILEKLNSYVEYSPSGKGLHAIVKADLKGKRKLTVNIDGQSVEVLTPGNFVTFTGDNISTLNEIFDHTDLILSMYSKEEKKDLCATHRIKGPIGGGGNIRKPSAYGLAAVRHEADNVKRAFVGNRTLTLLRAAFKLGQLIPGGYVDEVKAIRDLDEAGGYVGLMPGKIKKTIADGIEKGKKQPRTFNQI